MSEKVKAYDFVCDGFGQLRYKGTDRRVDRFMMQYRASLYLNKATSPVILFDDSVPIAEFKNRIAGVKEINRILDKEQSRG